MRPVRLVAVKEIQPRPSTAIETAGVCRAQCPGGNRCQCIGVHKLHICTDPKCYCHTQERYRKERVK